MAGIASWLIFVSMIMSSMFFGCLRRKLETLEKKMDELKEEQSKPHE